MNQIIAKPQGFKMHLVSAVLAAAALAGCTADEGKTLIGNGPAPTIGTLTATPNSVAPGGSTTISFQSSGASECTAAGQLAGRPIGTSGSETVTVPSVPGVYTYGITCTNGTGQQVTQFVPVTVVGAPTGGNAGDITPAPGTPGVPTDLLPNDGTTPSTVTENGVPLAGNFICTAGARTYGTPVVTVGANGLVGDLLTPLLNTLGAGSATQLVNSITAKELVVDGNLNTAAQYNLTLGLLGALITTLDLNVGLGGVAPVGSFAVFGLTFPVATLEASLLQSVTVETLSVATGETVLDTATIDATTLDLLGAVATGPVRTFVGVKVTQPYDRARIRLNPAVLSANVGNAMNVHELCTDGRFVAAP